MICLGIESSANDFSVGIVDSNGHVLSLVTSSYIPPKGGIHPREAARHHAQSAPTILRRALEEASISIKEVDVIAFTQGPGLGPALRTGATVARTLAAYFNKPLVGVNHCVAHVEIGCLLLNMKNPLTVYVSGGNSLITRFEEGFFRVYGETLDIALGNLLDSFAQRAGLPFPGGPAVERLAKRSQRYIELPYTVKGMDLSFSGLLTHALRLLKQGVPIEDVCYSLQETAFAMVCEVAERALAHTRSDELMLTGGVAANQRLQEMLAAVAKEHGARFGVVDRRFAVDNGAMIAWTGLLAYQSGAVTPIRDSLVKPRWRIDQVPIPWRKHA